MSFIFKLKALVRNLFLFTVANGLALMIFHFIYSWAGDGFMMFFTFILVLVIVAAILSVGFQFLKFKEEHEATGMMFTLITNVFFILAAPYFFSNLMTTIGSEVKEIQIKENTKVEKGVYYRLKASELSMLNIKSASLISISGSYYNKTSATRSTYTDHFGVMPAALRSKIWLLWGSEIKTQEDLKAEVDALLSSPKDTYFRYTEDKDYYGALYAQRPKLKKEVLILENSYSRDYDLKFYGGFTAGFTVLAVFCIVLATFRDKGKS